jgi:hypothetical protein
VGRVGVAQRVEVRANQAAALHKDRDRRT